jgi:hypothetical protein
MHRRLGDPKAGLDAVEKRKFLTLPRFELRPLGRPVRSQSLHYLRYSGSIMGIEVILILVSIGLPKTIIPFGKIYLYIILSCSME